MNSEEYLDRKNKFMETRIKLSEYNYDITSEENITLIKITKKEEQETSKISFILCGHMLIAFGNFGQAIYEFGQNHDLNSFKDIDLDTFASKCVASPIGSKYRKWDASLTIMKFEEYLVKYLKEKGIEETPDDYMNQDCYEEYGNPLDIEYNDMCNDDRSWYEWLSSTPFGYHDLADIGWVAVQDCIYQWIAIKIAAEKNIANEYSILQQS